MGAMRPDAVTASLKTCSPREPRLHCVETLTVAYRPRDLLSVRLRQCAHGSKLSEDSRSRAEVLDNPGRGHRGPQWVEAHFGPLFRSKVHAPQTDTHMTLQETSASTSPGSGLRAALTDDQIQVPLDVVAEAAHLQAADDRLRGR